MGDFVNGMGESSEFLHEGFVLKCKIKDQYILVSLLRIGVFFGGNNTHLSRNIALIISSIFLPGCRIVENIFGYILVCFFVSDDTVVITSLP